MATQSAIWFFDSFEQFWASRSRINFRFVGSKKIRNLIYCRENSVDKIERHIRQAEKSNEFYEPQIYGNDRDFPLWWTFVMEQGSEIYLESITLFSPQHCGEVQLLEINKFSKRNSKWTTESFFFVDVLNFHGCKLVFGVNAGTSQIPFYTLQAVDSSLNFTIIALNHRRRSSVKVIEYLATNAIIEDIVEVFHMTSWVFSDTICLTVPFGEPLTPLEQMFYPFDNDVWILFVTTFIIAYSVILIIKLSGRVNIADLVFGEREQSPSLNVFSIFMGVTVLAAPRKNFARFLLVAFTIFCLIIR